MKIRYKTIKLTPSSLKVVEQANGILREYASAGITITLRTLYYQFVARDLLPNRQKEYKRLGSILNDARLSGLVDWTHMEDRTRNLAKLSEWDDPSDIVAAIARQFRVDMWENQEFYVEVWIEKDALIGVIEGTCNDLRVPYFSCRGFTSQSEMWAASQRLLGATKGRKPVIIHLGDHDPSGIDMSRDIQDRLNLFMAGGTGYLVEFQRLALNMDQVEEYGPPPNPAKTTDSRYHGYALEHGEESWELDALEPRVIARLIRSAIDERRDLTTWEVDEQREEDHKKLLAKCSEHWDKVAAFLDKKIK